MQWTNLQCNNRFINTMQLYIFCEKSGGLHLAEQSLSAVGKQAGSQSVSRNSGEVRNFLKLAVDQNIRFNAFLTLFQANIITSKSFPQNEK